MNDQNALSNIEARFAQMQNILNNQNEVIAELSAQKSARTPFADDIKRQFLKSPLKFYKEVNPRKPTLSFDGSNYLKWETAIDRTLQHAFVLEKSFLNDDKDKFIGLDLLENKAVAALMRSTLDDALLSIVESQELSTSKELFVLLGSKCKRSGRRHKIMLVEKMIRFTHDNMHASESWLARFCSIVSDVERSKLTIDEFCGLFLQAIAKAPPGSDEKNFEYSISQPLDDMPTPPTFGQVTTIIQSALSKVSRGSTSVLSPGTIPSDVEMSTVNAINKAAFYRGKGHSDSLMERFGYTCLYCRETGHWLAFCASNSPTPCTCATSFLAWPSI
ncbi:hypothetical protein VP01_926g1 [Puccinia sorghi]|uniref:Dcp1p-Dcp2p decapping enzyme complex alpha subunit n=1 Tax=Puccinia sorghi TaxID=27349 RepID=A0A0L6U7R8_9BASI|nr:hypothetical protein VP01_926g1 [Puccinia sorghi]